MDTESLRALVREEAARVIDTVRVEAAQAATRTQRAAVQDALQRAPAVFAGEPNLEHLISDPRGRLALETLLDRMDPLLLADDRAVLSAGLAALPLAPQQPRGVASGGCAPPAWMREPPRRAERPPPAPPRATAPAPGRTDDALAARMARAMRLPVSALREETPVRCTGGGPMTTLTDYTRARRKERRR